MKDSNEIERKYLVKELPLDYKAYPSKHIKQTYVYLTDLMDIRIREVINGSEVKYYYTVKINNFGTMPIRREIETEIDKDLYDSLQLDKARNTSSINKTRYNYPLGGGLNAEIDFYEDDLEGLETIEVEFDSLFEMDFFTEPEWFGKDVTGEEEYKNKNLCINGNSILNRKVGK